MKTAPTVGVAAGLLTFGRVSVVFAMVGVGGCGDKETGSDSLIHRVPPYWFRTTGVNNPQEVRAAQTGGTTAQSPGTVEPRCLCLPACLQSSEAFLSRSGGGGTFSSTHTQATTQHKTRGRRKVCLPRA